MTWEDRLQPAAYTGPDGTRVQFTFLDLRGVIRKKTKAHELASFNGTYVQDKGLKGQQFPMRVVFHGEDHDLQAELFERVIEQTGPGRIEHPMYGSHIAIPFGDTIRNDNVVTGANETIFDVVFWVTVKDLYPSSEDATLQSIDDAANDYDNSAADQFADSVELSNPSDWAKFKGNMGALKDGARSALRKAQDGTAKLENRMNRIDAALQGTLDLVVADPLTVVFQLRRLIGAPARSAKLLKKRLAGYKSMMTSIEDGGGTGNGGGTGSSESGTGIVSPGTAAPGALADASNTFHANRLVAEVTVIAIAQAVAAENYTTRREALDSALELATIYDSMVAWSDSNYAVLFEASAGPDATKPKVSGVGAIDTGEAAAAVLDVVTKAVSYLIATSFNLGVERSIILSTHRTVIDLGSELLGDSFVERFDEFVAANDFNGDELLELKPGTMVRYYAK